MPATKNVVVIDPQGQALTVDILDSHSVSVTAYTASGGSTAHTLPLAITTKTSFHLTDGGEFTVSAKYAGVEIAGQVVSARGGVPVEVKPVFGVSESAVLAAFAKLVGTSDIEITDDTKGLVLHNGTNKFRLLVSSTGVVSTTAVA